MTAKLKPRTEKAPVEWPEKGQRWEKITKAAAAEDRAAWMYAPLFTSESEPETAYIHGVSEGGYVQWRRDELERPHTHEMAVRNFRAHYRRAA